MASANVELVRSIFAAWERGDFSSAGWADPEIEFVLAGGGPGDGVWTGLAGMAQGWRRFLTSWDSYRVEAGQCVELDDERVLVLPDVSGRGKVSGLDLTQLPATGAVLFELRDGKVKRLTVHADRDGLLGALGVRP